MDDMELRNKMDFIVEQQAQFSVDIQKLREAQAEQQGQFAELKDVVARLANASLRRFEEVEQNQTAIISVQLKTGEQISDLAQAQTRTQEQLDALTVMFERSINREDR